MSIQAPKKNKKITESSEKTASPSIFSRAFKAIKNGLKNFWASIKKGLSKIGSTLSGKKPDSNTEEVEWSVQLQRPPVSQYTQDKPSQEQSVTLFQREVPKTSEPAVRSNPSESIYDMQKRREHEAGQREIARLEQVQREREQERLKVQREQETRRSEEDINQKHKEQMERALKGEAARKEWEQREGERIAMDLKKQYDDMQKGAEELKKVLSKVDVTKDEIRLAAAAQIAIAQKFISDELHLSRYDREQLRKIVTSAEYVLKSDLSGYQAESVVSCIGDINKKIQEIEPKIASQKEIKRLARENITEAERLMNDKLHTPAWHAIGLNDGIQVVKHWVKPDAFLDDFNMPIVKFKLEDLSKKIKAAQNDAKEQVDIRERSADLITKAQLLIASINTTDADKYLLKEKISTINLFIRPGIRIDNSCMPAAAYNVDALSAKIDEIDKKNTIKLR